MITLVPLDPARHCLHRMGTGAGLYLCRRRAGHADGHEFLPLDMVSLAAPDPAIPSDNPIQKEPAPRVA